MSSPIVPTQGTTGAEPAISGAPDRSRPVAAGEVSPAGWLTQLESAVSREEAAGGPPAEVLDRMAHAAQSYERLTEQGRELRFVHDEAGACTGAELRDSDGKVLKRLSLAEACEIADGAPLD